MSRGPFLVEPRQTDKVTGGHEIAVVALQTLQDVVSFIRSAALAEGKARDPEFRISLGKLAALKKKKALPSLRQLCYTASSIFGVEHPKILEILAEYKSGCDGARWSKAFDKARREIMERRKPGALASCYFDPFARLTNSSYRMGDPFCYEPFTNWTWDVVAWMSYVANQRVDRSARPKLSPDDLARKRWFQAAVADIVTRLPNAGDPSEVWNALETIGFQFKTGMKKAILKQLKGEFIEFSELKRDAGNWTFDPKLCDDARKRWADNWADRFAEDLNNTYQGIVRYEDNRLYSLDLASSLSNMNRWIRHNTRYCVPRQKEDHLTHPLVPHEAFVQALVNCCREGWYCDIGLALQRFAQRERARLGELSSLSSAGTLETSVEKLDADLRELGLTLTELAMKMIIEGLSLESRLECSVIDVQTRVPMIKRLQQHAFEVNPELVSKIAASRIKDVLSSPQHKTARKRPHD